jgi:hypothetical protein
VDECRHARTAVDFRSPCYAPDIKEFGFEVMCLECGGRGIFVPNGAPMPGGFASKPDRDGIYHRRPDA